jgi:LysW-gamma-L-lysine carboxypeptidase
VSLSAFVDAVADISIQEDWQIIVIGAVDKEKDSRGARHLVSHFQPEITIIGEPSCWDRITLGYKGSTIVELSITTLKSHSTANQKNACKKIKMWCSIQNWVNQFYVDKKTIFDLIPIFTQDQLFRIVQRFFCKFATELPKDL